MTYYRVKPEYDGKQVKPGRYLIAKELYTFAELLGIGFSPCPLNQMFEIAIISKKATYIMFGARFEAKKFIPLIIKNKQR